MSSLQPSNERALCEPIRQSGSVQERRVSPAFDFLDDLQSRPRGCFSTGKGGKQLGTQRSTALRSLLNSRGDPPCSSGDFSCDANELVTGSTCRSHCGGRAAI